jgi:hypothetical protein
MFISKMARNLTDCQHAVKSPERRHIFEHLMCVGGYYHNIGVLESGSGQLIVLRRPTDAECALRDLQPRDYTPCQGCLGFVTKSALWKHVRRCKDISLQDRRERGSMQQASSLLIHPIISTASPEFTKLVLERMSTYYVTEVAAKDWLITQLGLLMFRQYGKSQRQLIATRMRILSRLLTGVRELTNNKSVTLLDRISSDYIDSIVTVVRKFCDTEFSRYSRPVMKNRPSFALKIGHELRRCAELTRNFALKQHNANMLQRVEAFIKVRKFEWPSAVSGAALWTLSKRKQSKADMLPCTEDLMRLM